MIYTDVAIDVHMDACRSYIETDAVTYSKSLVTEDPIHRIGYRINPSTIHTSKASINHSKTQRNQTGLHYFVAPCNHNAKAPHS